MSDVFVLFGIDVQALQDSIRPPAVIRASDTLGVIEQPMFSHVLQNSSISYKELQALIGKTLQMYHLLDAVMILFKDLEEPIKLSLLFERLNRGQYYKKLKQQNPVWLLTNRQTPFNIKIIITSILLQAAKKMTFQQIKQIIMTFSLQQRKTGWKGVPLSSQKIIGILRHLNKTISLNFLEQWIKINKFQIQNFILPHEFLYLNCYCSDRSSYLRLIPKANYSSYKNPHTNLYDMLSIKQITGTPDSKIQDQLRQTIIDVTQKQDTKQNKNQNKCFKKVSVVKSYRNLSSLQKMLRQNSMYPDIKRCLKTRQKSSKIVTCVNSVKNSNRVTTRPKTATHPIRLQQIVNKQVLQFDFLTNTNFRSSYTDSRCNSQNITRRNHRSYIKDNLRNIVEKQTQNLNDKMKRPAFYRSENTMI